MIRFLKQALLFTCVIATLRGVAQEMDSEYLYKKSEHRALAVYQFDTRYEYLILNSGFAKESVEKIPFTDRRIVKIDLVNTRFRESSEFNQRQLDIRRLQGLIEINPLITVNTFIDWNIYSQTGCNSSGECSAYFHGFVIYYEDYFTKETSVSEVDSIKTELNELDQTIIDFQKLLKIDFSRIDCVYPESTYSQEYLSDRLKHFYNCSENYDGRVLFDVYIDYRGKVKEVVIRGTLFPCKDRLKDILEHILQWKRGLVLGRKQFDIKATGFVTFPIKKESVNITGYEISTDLMTAHKMVAQYPQCVAYETDTTFRDLFPKIEKKVVTNVFLRNNLDPELIVVDVTGSMYPFTADLLKWIRLINDDKARHYVFFNDGDDKPTNRKIIGQTGGLYHIQTSEFSEARDKLFEAMRAGGGGDLPENNIEALMFGLKQANPKGEVVMIADNYSFPRDVNLLAKYSGRLKIILCHTEKGLNTDYLNLARKHGFTIHTMKSDLIDLNKPKLEVEGVEYRYEQNGFVRVR